MQCLCRNRTFRHLASSQSMTVLKCISMVIVSKNPVKCTEHGITKVQAVRQSGGTNILH